jgi:hypothetical protein
MHTIKLTDEQMNVVGQALGELPFKVSAPIIQAINAQLQAAQVPPAPDGGGAKQE